MTPKTLETERLLLTAPDVKYAADLHEYGSDPKFCAFIDAPPTKSAEDAASFLDKMSAANQADERCYWIVVDRTNGQAVGTLGLLFPYAHRHRVADFGYGFSPKVWGTGVFQEAGKAVVHFGLTNLNLVRIQAFTRADNIAAIEGVKKIGFEEEANLKSFYQTGHGRADATVLAKVKQA